MVDEDWLWKGQRWKRKWRGGEKVGKEESKRKCDSFPWCSERLAVSKQQVKFLVFLKTLVFTALSYNWSTLANQTMLDYISLGFDIDM